MGKYIVFPTLSQSSHHETTLSLNAVNLIRYFSVLCVSLFVTWMRACEYVRFIVTGIMAFVRHLKWILYTKLWPPARVVSSLDAESPL